MMVSVVDDSPPLTVVRPGQGLGFVSIGELLAEPDEEVQWLHDGVIPAGGTALIVAKPKVGKSVTVRGLSGAVPRGTPFLGRATQQGPVLYLALEEKRAEVRRQFAAMGMTDDDPLYLYVSNAPEEAMEWLAAATREYRPVLIVIDTLQRLLRVPDLNDYAQVTIALEPLTALARQSGAAVLFVHHSRKALGEGGDAVLGSTGLFGAVDTLIEMRRYGDRRTIQTVQRYGADLEESVIALETDTYTLSLAGTRHEADVQAVGTDMRAFLEAQTAPVPESDIVAAVEGRTGLIRETLRQLCASGDISRTGEGVRNSPYQYSRFLVPTSIREQENEKPEAGGLWRPDAENSRSHTTAPALTGEAPERDDGAARGQRQHPPDGLEPAAIKQRVLW